MKLNANMIYEALRKTENVSLLGDSRRERTLRFPCFFDGELSHLMSGGVYLAESQEIPRKAPDQQNILWVSWGSQVPKAIPKCPVLFFHEETRPHYILNLIQDIFVRFFAWKDSLDDILNNGSNVHRMLAASEPLFQHPLCVLDTVNNYLGYTESFMNIGTQVFLPKRAEGDERKLHGATPPPYYKGEKDLVRQMQNRDFTLGTLCMIHTDEPFSETELILFDLLEQKLTVALQNLSMLQGLYRNSFKHQMQEYFATKQAVAETLYESLGQWGGQQGDRFICYKVKASHINQKINAEYICSIFENVIASSIAFWHDAVLVVLVDVTRNGSEEQVLHEKIADLLTHLEMKAGVSLSFTEVEDAWYHFRQACCAFDEGYPVRPEDTLYFFQDFVPSYMLHHAMGEFPKYFLLDKGMQALLEHDQQYAVSYVDTLNTFFECRMNMSQTADLLGIHRTSLNSRMQKIWECLEHELTPEYLLYLQVILAILNSQG